MNIEDMYYEERYRESERDRERDRGRDRGRARGRERILGNKWVVGVDNKIRCV